jgi:hypothetical protein
MRPAVRHQVYVYPIAAATRTFENDPLRLGLTDDEDVTPETPGHIIHAGDATDSPKPAPASYPTPERKK